MNSVPAAAPARQVEPPGRRLRPISMRALVLLTILPLAVSCAADRVPVAVLYAQEDGATLRISVDTCQGNPELLDVTQSASAVEVTVVSDDQPRQRPACADHVNVQLDQPLGTRKLIDGSTGEPVGVR
jgi:hypothetical protein